MWNQLKTILLFGVLAALLVGIGGALAPSYLGVFVVLALLMNVGAYFFSDKLVVDSSVSRGARASTAQHAGGTDAAGTVGA